MKQKYRVKGVEDVYDNFDNLEKENPLPPLIVEAGSLEEALKIGTLTCQKIISQERFAKGYVHSPDSSSGSTGTYYARIEEICDFAGNILYEQKITRLW